MEKRKLNLSFNLTNTLQLKFLLLFRIRQKLDNRKKILFAFLGTIFYLSWTYFENFSLKSRTESSEMKKLQLYSTKYSRLPSVEIRIARICLIFCVGGGLKS